jgi:hypothetical protein
MPLPLEGVRILDFSRLYPGPLASLMLSDMGAEVIKIEDPTGDGIRHYPPHYEDGNGIKFHALNRGKKSIVLNLKKDEDIQKFLQMLPNVHVVIESFRPRVLEKLLKLQNIEELFKYNSHCTNITSISNLNYSDYLKNFSFWSKCSRKANECSCTVIHYFQLFTFSAI